MRVLFRELIPLLAKNKNIMLALKCIGGAILGTVIGFVAFIVGWIALKIVVGLIFWDAKMGDNAAVLALFAVPIGMIVGFIRPINKALNAKREAEEAHRMKIEAAAQAQLKAEESERRRIANEEKQKAKQIRTSCSELAIMKESAHTKLSALSDHLSEANRMLDVANNDFNERAFAPFWDALERATNNLGAYHQDIEEIRTTAAKYDKKRSRLVVEVPTLDIPSNGIPDARPLATRLSSLCREAQKDFQFATIYEQRKTNQLLYSGFGTLAAGLERMQFAITDALDELSTSLGKRLDEILDVSIWQAETVSDLYEASQEHFEASSKHYAASESYYSSTAKNLEESTHELKKQSKMLDNIQRDQKPPEGIIERMAHLRVKGDTTTPHDVAADD